MSVHVISWVLRFSDEELAARLVLIVLADHASGDGTGAYPSVATIATEARLNPRTVQRALRGLEGRGAIGRMGVRPNGCVIYAVQMGGDNLSVPASSTHWGGRVPPEPSFNPLTELTSTRF